MILIHEQVSKWIANEHFTEASDRLLDQAIKQWVSDILLDQAIDQWASDILLDQAIDRCTSDRLSN